MTEEAKRKLAAKAIREYAREHWGWAAKYYPEQYEKWLACMEMADKLENQNRRENGNGTNI